MRWRDFITVFGGAAVVAPLAAHAQRARVRGEGQIVPYIDREHR